MAETSEALRETSDALIRDLAALENLEDTPRAIATILAEWRDAERRGSASDVARLREEYRRAHEAARRPLPE